MKKTIKGFDRSERVGPRAAKETSKDPVVYQGNSFNSDPKTKMWTWLSSQNDPCGTSQPFSYSPGPEDTATATGKSCPSGAALYTITVYPK